MAFGRRKKGTDATVAGVHHRSMRRRVLGYLVVLLIVFVGVMAVLTYFSPTETTVR